MTPNPLYTLGRAVTQPLHQNIPKCPSMSPLVFAPGGFIALHVSPSFFALHILHDGRVQSTCLRSNTIWRVFLTRMSPKASKSNNRLHCLRECTAAATNGRAPLSHRFSTNVHVGVVGCTWAFRCGYNIRFSKLLKLLVFDCILLSIDVLV